MPRHRPSARLILTDPASRVLLFHFHLADGRVFWATPGGGLEEGESFEAAARRELMEETGLDLPVSGPPVLDLAFEMAMPDGEWVAARECYFRVAVDAFTLDATGWTELEKSIMTAHRWWTAEELGATTETVYPAGLAGLLVEFPLGR